MGVKGFPGLLLDGAVGALTLTAGKVVTRAVPKFLNLDRSSNVGLGVELATAVVAGFLTDLVAGPSWGAWMLAGGLTAPLEDAIIRYQVPFVTEYLTPGAGTVGVYAPRPFGGVRAMLAAPKARSLPRGRGVVADWMTPYINSGAGVVA